MGVYAYESRFIEVEGGMLHCRVAGEEDGLPLLYVHGLSGFSKDVEVLELPDGLRVISPDLPGFGDSFETEDHRYPHGLMVSCLIAALSSFANAPAVVVGHSRGARTILGLPVAAPAQVRALVMVDGAPSVPAEARMGVARNIAGTPHRFGSLEEAREVLGPRFPGYTEEQLAERLNHYLRAAPDGSYHVKRDLVYKKEFQAVLDGTGAPEAGPDWWALYAKAEVPIYFVHALKSKMLNRDIRERMLAIHPGLRIFEVDSTHNVPGDQPKQLSSIIGQVAGEWK